MDQSIETVWIKTASLKISKEGFVDVEEKEGVSGCDGFRKDGWSLLRLFTFESRLVLRASLVVGLNMNVPGVDQV